MSTLFCGVFVKAASLCFAADAYDAEHRTLLAVDLICARRNSGRLSSASVTNPIARVPVEVWSLVQQELVNQAIKRAEHSALAPYACNCSSPTCLSRPERWTWDAGKRWLNDSDLFWDDGGLEEMLHRRSEKIESLLDAFGLDLPLDSLHTTGSVLDALEALGLTLRSTTDAANRPSFAERYFSDHSYSVAQISHSALPLPPERAPRLIRFLALFNLAVDNPSSSTLYASSHRPRSAHTALTGPSMTTTNNNSKKTQDKLDHQRVCCSDPRTAPHWWLVTTLIDASSDDEFP
ncbi:hypothetical protein JCM11491_001362 [Sporobolomyces phaffii]